MTNSLFRTVRQVLCSILAAAACALAFSAPAAAQAIIEGTWATVSKSEITIAACETGFCGTLSTIVVPEEIKAQYGEDIEALAANYTDEMNKDPALRSRPIQGLQILALRATDNPWYFEGEVYNPQDGNTYSGAVTVLGADMISLKGCALFVLCREEQWTRVMAPVTGDELDAAEGTEPAAQ